MTKRLRKSHKTEDRIRIRYVEPQYESEAEREAAIAKAQEALLQLARLLGRIAATKAIENARQSKDIQTDAIDD